jgi:hypothetical protein
MMNKKILFFIFLAGMLCFSFSKSAFAGLGIIPSDWIEPNGMQGQQIEKTFTLVRKDASEDLYFASKITGDLTNWIKIENGNNFVMPKGQQQFPVKITLNIPQNAEKKQYKGEIRLNSETNTEKASTGSVGVLLSSLVRIDLTISDKPFIDYDILRINVPKQEEGNFVNVVLKINNKGNVEAKPTKITTDIFDKFNSAQITSQTITDFSAIKGVPPFSQGEIKLQIPAQLTPEQYWANISVYQDDKILKTDSITFEIVKKGTLKKENAASQYFKNNYILILGIILAIALIAGIAIGIWLFIKHKNNKKQINHKKHEHNKL